MESKARIEYFFKYTILPFQTDDLSNRLLTVLSVNPTDVKEVRYTLEVLLPEVTTRVC
jgi:hypothetical protein